MTVKELKEELKDVPEDAIVCVPAAFGTDKYEVSSLEYLEEEDYYDAEDNEAKGNIILL